MAAEKPDPMMEAVKAARQRSGAGVGPAKPMSDEMKRRINQDMDKMGIGGKKTSSVDTDSDVVSAKKGGVMRSASSRADGIATKGKTKGTMIMCGGGMARKK
jgi:hypothetical protein